MATILRYPQRFLEEHSRWHMNMRMDIRPGDGFEFLSFHRNFIRKSLRWYNKQGLNPRRVTAWSSIPIEIKRHPRWNIGLQAAEDRITRNLASFQSSDALGVYLQTSSLHDSIHVIGSEVYNDSDFGQIRQAPRSTLFYNWHGLIDNWWMELERNRNPRSRVIQP